MKYYLELLVAYCPTLVQGNGEINVLAYVNTGEVYPENKFLRGEIIKK